MDEYIDLKCDETSKSHLNAFIRTVWEWSNQWRLVNTKHWGENISLKNTTPAPCVSEQCPLQISQKHTFKHTVNKNDTKYLIWNTPNFYSFGRKCCVHVKFRPSWIRTFLSAFVKKSSLISLQEKARQTCALFIMSDRLLVFLAPSDFHI